MLDLSTLKIKPVGFGLCRKCPYFETGPAELCFSCARQTMQALANVKCAVCDHPYDDGEDWCNNPICKRSTHRRHFRWNYAVAMKSGSLDSSIKNYKFDDDTKYRYWAIIFARVLVGFLQDESEIFRNFNLIVASPTFVGPGGRPWDHTRFVLETAHIESRGAWPFDVGYKNPVIIKTAATRSMTKSKSWQERDEIAEGELRDALKVTDSKRTDGKNILVYDDVFTDGHTLNEVARCLKMQGGAAEVCGVTLARAHFQPRH